MNNEDILTICGLVGAALLETQKVEFLVHGIVSHLMHVDELSSKKQLKGLSPKVFLSDDPKDRKKRRQTLGVLVGAIKIVSEKTIAIDEERLSLYLDNRNTFVHGFWREYLKNEMDIDGGLAFINSYISETDHWNKMFKGILGLFMRASATNEGRTEELSQMNTMDEEVAYFLAYEKLNKAKQQGPSAGTR